VTGYLVDDCVWARLASGDPGVAARLRRIERAPDETTVLTADRDFDRIARASELRHEYIAPSS